MGDAIRCDAGDWVEVEYVLLEPGQRAAGIPDEGPGGGATPNSGVGAAGAAAAPAGGATPATSYHAAGTCAHASG